MQLSDVMARIEPVTESGCWLWTGHIGSKGYGMVWHNDKYIRAHRVVYLALKGPIPEGLILDHLCRVKCCVNPDHMEVVTNRMNVLRGVNPVAVNSRKTGCVNGHPYTAATLRIDRDGSRRCMICRKAKDRIRRAKYKALSAEAGEEKDHE